MKQKKGTDPTRIFARARSAFSDPFAAIVKHIVHSMSNDDILAKIVGPKLENLPKLSEDLKVQLYMTMPAAREMIDPSTLSADLRVMLACLSPSDKGRPALRFETNDRKKGDAEWILEHMGKLALDRDDITANHVRFILQRHDKTLTRVMYKYINHNLLTELKAMDWHTMLRDVPNSGKFLDITKLRNQSNLRYLILSHPVRVFKHVTLDDMKNSVIDAPGWIRIISHIPAGKRMFVPTGVIEWATKEVFRHKLKGRSFKKFVHWTDGIGTVSQAKDDDASA